MEKGKKKLGLVDNEKEAILVRKSEFKNCQKVSIPYTSGGSIYPTIECQRQHFP